MKSKIKKSITNYVNDGKWLTILNVDQDIGKGKELTEDLREC